MKRFLKEIISELKLVLTGKTLDILLPPILFLVLNNTLSLIYALIGSFILTLYFFIKRIKNKDNLYYAVGGLLGVIGAIVLVYINNNAANFFLPDIIGTSFLIVATIISLLIKKPLAVWVSHITRGWNLNWFYREDILPAYREVTYFWLGFFILRLSVEVFLYLNSSVEDIVFVNIILGLPVLILVLTISYVYGIARLKKLGGPGIDEYMNKKVPPYRGQIKGF